MRSAAKRDKLPQTVGLGTAGSTLPWAENPLNPHRTPESVRKGAQGDLSAKSTAGL